MKLSTGTGTACVDSVIRQWDAQLTRRTAMTLDRSRTPRSVEGSVTRAILERNDIIAASVRLTVDACDEIEGIVRLFLAWMEDEAIVRVLGEGRARLAAAIPANRLAHGGARVYVQDGLVPMPNTSRGGGVIAASASGATRSVLRALESLRNKAPEITVVGIADAKAHDFMSHCHHFIGIREDRSRPNPLNALADTAEYVLSLTLDALVVAAGELGQFDQRRWCIGHEDIGDTGPYTGD